MNNDNNIICNNCGIDIKLFFNNIMIENNCKISKDSVVKWF